MIRDLQLTVGDVCGDATGLCVMVDYIDSNNRVHFSVIEEGVENWTMRGEISRDAFMHRFLRWYRERPNCCKVFKNMIDQCTQKTQNQGGALEHKTKTRNPYGCKEQALIPTSA